MSALKPSLLRMFTADDTVGVKLVSGTEMWEHRKVSGLVTMSKAERSVVKLIAVV